MTEIMGLSPKLVVWCFFHRYGRTGATLGMVARDLRRARLAEGSQRSVRPAVRAFVEQWIKEAGRTHRAIGRISAGRYRATVHGR
jgi:hypothetical protein